MIMEAGETRQKKERILHNRRVIILVLVSMLLIGVFYRGVFISTSSALQLRHKGPSADPVYYSTKSLTTETEFSAYLENKLITLSHKSEISDDQIAYLHAILANTRARPAHLGVYFFYDATARVALMEMNVWLKARTISTPIFVQSTPIFCVGIMTARRKEAALSPVVQTVTGLLTRMDVCKEKENFNFRLFNVDDNPDEHTNLREIDHLMPVTNIKNIQHKAAHRKEQETLDYIEVFRRMYKDNTCPYMIVLEDDALAEENWTVRVKEIAAALDGKKWSYTYLFTNEEGTERGLTEKLPYWSTVAIMYNRQHLLKFADELEKDFLATTGTKNFYPKDGVIKNVAKKLELPAYSHHPSVFDHTGVFSSVQTQSTDSVMHHEVISAKLYDSRGVPVEFQPNRWSC
jgi:hypothetical protein